MSRDVPIRIAKQYCHNPTQLNPKLGRPYFPMINHKPQPQPKPTPTFSQLLHNQTPPNSGCNLVSTQLEDSYQNFKMEDDLKNFKMEDDVKIFKMEDDLKNFKMEDDLKNFRMEDDLKNF